MEKLSRKEPATVRSITMAKDAESPTPTKPGTAFVTFMEGLHLDCLDVEHEADRGRDIRPE